jgi:uncharacterized protein (DUF1015 family)
VRLRPFRAIRPRPELADKVASVPYDVVNREEAFELARGNPHSFLHVGRSDIDLPPDTDPHDPSIYAKAREALDRLLGDGVLMRDQEPAFYLYRQVMNGRTQTGVVWGVSISMTTSATSSASTRRLGRTRRMTGPVTCSR